MRLAPYCLPYCLYCLPTSLSALGSRYNGISLTGSCDASVGSAALVVVVTAVLAGFKTLLWLTEQIEEVRSMVTAISWPSVVVRSFLMFGETVWAVGASVVAA